MIGQLVKNKKGEIQLDKFGRNLLIGQPVLVMDSVHYKGSRGSVSTGVIVGFDRYVIVLTDGEEIVSDRQIQDHIRYYEDKADKSISKHWKSDYEERSDRGLERWPETVTSQYLIGCTEKVRRGWRNGSLFEE